MANPGGEVMKKLNKSKFLETMGHEWIFLTVGEAVGACNYMLHSTSNNKPKMAFDVSEKYNNNIV